MISFGIDFGTTNSIMALAKNTTAEVKTIPFYDRENRLPHPSIVWYSNQQVIVGREAKNHFNAYVEESGNKFVKSIKSHIADSKQIDIFGRKVYPYSIAGEIFKYLKTYAEKEYSTELDESIKEAVVSIPISFNGLQREALRRAANKAGIHIKTFIHEPFAAIIWFLNSRNDLFSQ